MFTLTDLVIQAYIGAVDNQLDVGHVHKLMSVVNWSTDYGGGIAIQCLEEGGEGSWEFNVFCMYLMVKIVKIVTGKKLISFVLLII